MSKIVPSLLFLLLAGPLTFSQNTPAGVRDTVTLDEVVVTASKVPLPQRETAKPVQIITRQDIDRRPVRDLAQLLDEVVGLTINGANSNPGLNKGVYLRGAGTAYTLLLIDGQPVADPTGVGGAIDLRLFPLDFIERIEVLKGSQSTLYGTDAIAGVINIITRRGGEQPLELRGSAAYGSNDYLDASAGLHGRTGTLDYHASYQRVQTKGISEAIDPAAGSDFDRDGFVQQGFQANAGLQLGAHLRLTPRFRLTDYAGDTDGDAFTDAPNRYEARLLNPGADARLEFESLTAQVSYDFHAIDRNFITEFGDFRYRGQFQNAEALVSYRLREHVQVMGGINVQQHRMLDTATAIADPAVRITSPYVTFLLRNLKGFNLELGYRFNHHTTFGNKSTVSVAPAYQATKNIRLFASFTTGFKAPTLSELYGAFGGNESLEPQSSVSSEAGLHTDWLDGRLQAGATYFRRRINNIIVYSFAAGHFNQDRQDDHGLELVLRWQPLPQWTVTGQYTFVDGQVTTRTSQEQDTSYFNLIRRPRHRIGLALDYRPAPKLSLRLQGQYAGKRIDYFFNPDNFYAIEEVDLDPYVLINFAARYQIWKDKISVFADLRNLTGASFMEVYGYDTLGFNAYGGVRFSF